MNWALVKVVAKLTQHRLNSDFTHKLASMCWLDLLELDTNAIKVYVMHKVVQTKKKKKRLDPEQVDGEFNCLFKPQAAYSSILFLHIMAKLMSHCESPDNWWMVMTSICFYSIFRYCSLIHSISNKRIFGISTCMPYVNNKTSLLDWRIDNIHAFRHC